MLTDRFASALIFAEGLHRGQTRKGVETPYVAHLLAVTATVLEWGADEDTAIGALLHDAVEDQGGEETAALIRARFGERVAELVLHCTDSLAASPGEKRPWEERKAGYLARLAEADVDVALITAADKLHNLTSTIRDVRTHGVETLKRFNQPGRVAWYYQAVVDALEPHRQQIPLEELSMGVATLVALIEEGSGPVSGAGHR